MIAFPHLADLVNDRLLITQLSDEDFRRAAFLDQRAMTPSTPKQWVPWDSATFDTTAMGEPRYIFHIGHVGSTLVSRLLADGHGLLPLREPLLLRTLADVAVRHDRPDCPWSPDRFEQRMADCRRWLLRRGSNGASPMVKATSFATSIANHLIGDDGRGLFLFASLRNYLGTILAGEASRTETLTLAPQRMVRLHRMVDGFDAPLWTLDPVTRVAAAWLCEIVTAGATMAAGRAVLWMDFDRFLADPLPRLAAVQQHYGLPVDESHNRVLLDGPVMRTYSKAPDHDYSPQLRNELIGEALNRHADAVNVAERWLETMRRRHPIIDKTMALVQED